MPIVTLTTGFGSTAVARRGRQSLVFLLAAVTAPVGCEVGSGTGHASGELFVLGCFEGDTDEERDLGAPGLPEPFDLEPTFFAGEPIDDIAPPPKMNRLIIRMQRSGRRRESNDVLAFDIVDTTAVARCVRQRVSVDANGQTQPDYDPSLCVATPSGTKLRVGTDSVIHASLSLRDTCLKNVVGLAISTPRTVEDGTGESWIELTHFGSAAQAGRTPAERDPIGSDFKVDLGERLHAPGFRLLLEDARVVTARRENEPIPAAQIGGSLTGFFDFDLERGQGGQTFP